MTHDEALAHVRAQGRPKVLNIDGHPYKFYPGGRVLCAATAPFHSFDGEACDCMERKSGGTIATITVPRRALTK